MTAIFAPRSAQVQSLLSPLESLDQWSDKDAARHELQLLVGNAIGTRNTSLWWNYIYLHEEYVARFSPEKHDILPGFPDMDTSVKLGAPSVYNWYYFHHKIPTTPWPDVHFSDLSLCRRAGAVDAHTANAVASAILRSSGLPFSPQDKSNPPVWLCETWARTPIWTELVNCIHNRSLQAAGVGALDRLVCTPQFLWQWQCSQKKDIGFLPFEDAAKALDALRMKSLDDSLRMLCERHFLAYFPEYKARADIAFSLGGPLWVDPVESLGASLPSDVFESGPEALHPK